MLNKLKNWWPQILFVLGAVIDFSIDFVPILLEEINVKPEVATYLRLFILAITIYKSKKSPSSNNPDVLYEQAADAQIKKGLE